MRVCEVVVKHVYHAASFNSLLEMLGLMEF